MNALLIYSGRDKKKNLCTTIYTQYIRSYTKPVFNKNISQLKITYDINGIHES